MRADGRWCASTIFALFALVLSQAAQAQVSCDQGGGLCTQRLQLTSGWNAIYLQVAPTSDAPADVFADLLDASGPRIESVWTWLARPNRIEFVQDQTTEGLLQQPGWLRWFPATDERSFLTNLFAVPGNRAYLVKLNGGSAQLNVTGRPLAPSGDWEPSAFNFTGFHVDPSAPPSFADYFGPAPALAPSAVRGAQKIFGLSADGTTWQALDPLTTLIEPGRAYWVWSEGGSDYTGPLAVELPPGGRFAYGTGLDDLLSRVQNQSSTAASLSVRVLGGASGVVYYLNPDPSLPDRWLPLPYTASVAGADTERLRIGVRRSGFAPGDYAAVLEIKGAGSRWLVPVDASASDARGLWVGRVSIDAVSEVNAYRRDCDASGGNPGSGYALCYFRRDCDNLGINPGSGTQQCLYQDFCNLDGEMPGSGGNLCLDRYTCDDLGRNPGSGRSYCEDVAGNPVGTPLVSAVPNVGRVVGDRVNGLPVPDPARQTCDATGANPGSGTSPCLAPTQSEFSFTILLHQDNTGQVRLLEQAIQMWNPGVGDTPGHYVLLTNDERISEYQGVTLRDGEAVGRRVSAINYDFPGDTLEMSGAFGGQLTASLVLQPNAPTNPFRHKYHPDHNIRGPDNSCDDSNRNPGTGTRPCLICDADGLNPGSGDRQCLVYQAYRVQRDIRLVFDDADGGELGAGSTVRGGSYREVVSGLHKDPLIAAGRFTLRHAARRDVLDN
jgi:hypothetical protein